MIISLIVAMGINREIGFKNKLLWNIPEDMKNFVRLTKGKPILIGRKTFESFKKPLPGRINIVITRDLNYRYEHELVKIFHNYEEALKFAGQLGTAELVICGGAQIYQDFLDKVDRMYISYVNWQGEADTFFPEFDFTRMKIINEASFDESENSPAWKFVEYKKI